MSEVRANPLVSAEVSELTAPIPLTHVSNFSDDFKEVNPSNSLEVEDDYYKMLLKDCVKDCVYFDSAPHPVKEMNDDNNCSHDNNSEEEMLDDSDDDGYNGYGGYNEYGERDRGYYCRDGGYERKTSPMMSPIIFPITA